MSAALAFSLSLVLIADAAAERTCLEPSAPFLTAWEECIKSQVSEREPSRAADELVANLAVNECAPLKRKYLIAISACMPLDKLLEYNDVLDDSERTLTAIKVYERRHPQRGD